MCFGALAGCPSCRLLCLTEVNGCAEGCSGGRKCHGVGSVANHVRSDHFFGVSVRVPFLRQLFIKSSSRFNLGFHPKNIFHLRPSLYEHISSLIRQYNCRAAFASTLQPLSTFKFEIHLHHPTMPSQINNFFICAASVVFAWGGFLLVSYFPSRYDSGD